MAWLRDFLLLPFRSREDEDALLERAVPIEVIFLAKFLLYFAMALCVLYTVYSPPPPPEAPASYYEGE